MNKSNNTNNTDDILDAIRDMMGDKNTEHQGELPKDVLELTKPIENNESLDDANILELNNPINQDNENKDPLNNDIMNVTLDDQKIRKLVREQVQLIPSEKLDQIIREELEKIISEKLMSAEINFKQKDKT
tara:strand:- start:477 stop:869 length:393 start_codon:yes stop_codon:yes gene_type:complete